MSANGSKYDERRLLFHLPLPADSGRADETLRAFVQLGLKLRKPELRIMRYDLSDCEGNGITSMLCKRRCRRL